MKNEQWLVGAEHDEKLFDALGASLRALGYSLSSKSWGVGGSQEISNWVVNGPKGKLTVEAETYIGLSVTGDTNLVNEVRQHFNNRSGR